MTLLEFMEELMDDEFIEWVERKCREKGIDPMSVVVGDDDWLCLKASLSASIASNAIASYTNDIANASKLTSSPQPSIKDTAAITPPVDGFSGGVHSQSCGPSGSLDKSHKPIACTVLMLPYLAP